MFTFGATHLQAVLTVPFFMNFAQRVLLEGMQLTEHNIGTVFDQSMFLARHTPIWFFWHSDLNDNFTLDKYDWMHLTMRPHGHDIGLQCPHCGSLSSRDGSFTNGEGSDIVVVCSKIGCTWLQCFRVPRGDVKVLTLGENGRWRSSCVPAPEKTS